MQSFIKSSFLTLIATFFKAISGIAIHKIIAITYGAAGLGVFGHFQNLITILVTLPGDGIGKALVRKQSQEGINTQEKSYFTDAILKLAFLILSVSLIILLAFRANLSLFIDTSNLDLLIGILVISTISLTLHIHFLNSLISAKKLIAYAVVISLTAIIVAATVYFAASYPLKYVLIAFALSQSSGILLSYLASKYYGVFHWKWQSFIPTNYRLEIGAFLGMAVISLFSGRLTDFMARSFVFDQFGAIRAGHWQAIFRISDSFFMILYAVISAVYYPAISSYLKQKEKLKTYVISVYKVVLPISFVAIGLSIFLRDTVISLLFDKSLLVVSPYYPIQAFGDFFHIIGSFASTIIVVRGAFKQFLYLEIFSAVSYYSLIYLCTNSLGFEGLFWAHSLRQLAYTLVVLYLAYSYLNSKN